MPNNPKVREALGHIFYCGTMKVMGRTHPKTKGQTTNGPCLAIAPGLTIKMHPHPGIFAAVLSQLPPLPSPRFAAATPAVYWGAF
ncbi:hypothetical protein [Acaryochloris marina]|uniref:Uncharacterized protein n=1 Tax=Acaryochloris marina (strain MBIC 11017) TaxID=329726 RepID=B0C0L6_ACAM1|nr:hypothetical protein [Acaryochloris marina]ABW30809.1 hypothetical protein AM1_5868 [Acaryochloris marina MBIC11017]BDM79560.1 hypothetical protein AM10699_24280 [Acaryochloris marina MBIC10699]